MLEITIPKNEVFVSETNMFIQIPETKLQLEHSLISLRKWESKWHKPFLGKAGKPEEKTSEEIIDYVRCMTVGKIPNLNIYQFIPTDILEQIVSYIKDPMTATWFGKTESEKNPLNGDTVTAEIIYYWMIALNVPVEFEKWHLNQLLTLIKVINIKNSPKKKMSKKEEAQQRAALNKARRAKFNSKG